jgi:hypothetical protein
MIVLKAIVEAVPPRQRSAHAHCHSADQKRVAEKIDRLSENPPSHETTKMKGYNPKGCAEACEIALTASPKPSLMKAKGIVSNNGNSPAAAEV